MPTAEPIALAAVAGQQAQNADALAVAGLPFALLSGVDLRIGTALRLPAFRVAGTDHYKRQTLLLDQAGTVRHAQMPITDPAGSVTEMLAVVRELAGP